MLDGNGQVWYDLYAKDIYILRPILFGVTGIKHGSISDLVLRYSPQYYNWIANSSSVTFDNINIAGTSQSKSPAKNTDGWDTYRSSNIVIQNSVINNGDDCVSFKPNSTEIIVQNLHCTKAKLTSSRTSSSPTSQWKTHLTAHASKCGPERPPLSPATSKAAEEPAVSTTSPTTAWSSRTLITLSRSLNATAKRI
jgi:hypothetical protein